MGELIIFYGLAALICGCSVMVVSSKNPVTSAVFLIFDLFLIAGIYALQDAHFMAAIQIIVYAGAILILFLFVIMLLNLTPEDLVAKKHKIPEYMIMMVSFFTFGAIAIALLISGPTGIEVATKSVTKTAIAAANKIGNTEAIGIELFSRFIWPFELASILILLAIVASIVIAKKDNKQPRKA